VPEVKHVDEKTLKTIPVASVLLDLDNPRFHHLRDQNGGKLTEELIEREILEKDEDLPALTKAIKKSGIKDPIWVVPKAGKFLVIEGNRRVVTLRQSWQPTADDPALRSREVHSGTSPQQ
jgi:hypothetical protein